MHDKIITALRGISQKEDVIIDLAIESGSRAWGFESANSDYDVRYIYTRPPNAYVSVFPTRDVIEGPADDTLDFSGWDMRKALGLLWKSNPCLFEWLQSPIVYHETYIGRAFRELAKGYFQPCAAMHHYLSMCRHNYREHMRNGEAPSVRLKKYLYITRPLLCCRWIERNPGFGAPPMNMRRLVRDDEGLGSAVSQHLFDLIDRKRAGEEMTEAPAVPELNAFIDCELVRLQAVANAMPRREVRAESLNAFLRRAVGTS